MGKGHAHVSSYSGTSNVCNCMCVCVYALCMKEFWSCSCVKDTHSPHYMYVNMHASSPMRQPSCAKRPNPPYYVQVYDICAFAPQHGYTHDLRQSQHACIIHIHTYIIYTHIYRTTYEMRPHPSPRPRTRFPAVQ
jgi:hypothetical protein